MINCPAGELPELTAATIDFMACVRFPVNSTVSSYDLHIGEGQTDHLINAVCQMELMNLCACLVNLVPKEHCNLQAFSSSVVIHYLQRSFLDLGGVLVYISLSLALTGLTMPHIEDTILSYMTKSKTLHLPSQDF